MKRSGLLAVFCLVAGIGVIVFGCTIAMDALASSSWPTTDGLVISTGVDETSSGTGTRRSRGYRPSVRYAYEVDGMRHEGDRISFADEVSKTRSHATLVINRYPVNAAVTVAYDPDDPGTSVLEPGASPASFLVAGFGVAVLALGLYVGITGRRGVKK